MTPSKDRVLNKLKPCPFCGNADIYVAPDETGSGVRHFGFYTAHADYRCVALLKHRAEAAEQALSASQQEVEALREALRKTS